nr:hypothetical protein Iba_scaffold3833CG0120 [Ipomoea batatas]
MLFEFPAPGLKEGIRGAKRSGSTIPAILLPEGEEAVLALGDSERMLMSPLPLHRSHLNGISQMEAERLEVNTRFRPSGKSTQQFLLLFQKL